MKGPHASSNGRTHSVLLGEDAWGPCMEGRIGKLYERTHLHGRTHTKIAWKYALGNNIESTHRTGNGRTHRVLPWKDVFNASSYERTHRI